MRKVILCCSIIGVYCLSSCSKQQLAEPQNTALSFSDFFASYQNNGVKVSFTAAHDDKVAYYEIYSGSDGHQLCEIGQFQPDENRGAH
ncbi:MAG: hypothetical protein ACREHG_01315, partial [Candidatus Saccharimonadales bacterium]